MDKQKIYGVIRNVIAAVGGFVVALGYSTSADVTSLLTSVEGVVGAVVTIVAIVTSVIAKVKGNIDNPTPAQAAAKEADAIDKAVK